jgi:release factor glutamine methyltransferase
MNLVTEDACISGLLQAAVTLLEGYGIETARVDAELLLGHCLDKSRTELYLAGAQRITGSQQDLFIDMIARRRRREPVAYIIGEREFWSRSFMVSPDVLIPRPETEFLVETALRTKRKAGEPNLCLDLCCGSGVIAIIVAMETGWPVIAADISHAALRVCKMNCQRLGVADKVSVVQSDLADGLAAQSRFDLIAANPPYVRHSEIVEKLEPEVAWYEPHVALDGGEDGLEVIRRIAGTLPLLLKPGGEFFMEIGHDQGENARNIFAGCPSRTLYQSVEVLKDYAGRDRIVHIRRTFNN